MAGNTDKTQLSPPCLPPRKVFQTQPAHSDRRQVGSNWSWLCLCACCFVQLRIAPSSAPQARAPGSAASRSSG